MANTRSQDDQLTGWPVLHLYFRIDRRRWSARPIERRQAAVAELQSWLQRCSAEEGLQLIPMAGIAKADVGLLAVHPEVRRIQQLGQEIAATELGGCLKPVYSFLSISEASEYMSTAGDWARDLIDKQGADPASPEFASQVAGFKKRMQAYAEARAHPQLPDAAFPVICFYPMRKSRTDARNWYQLDFVERKRYMGGHAAAGRTYADRVTQLVTSATGLDDWEWGVTLFSRDLKSIKEIVYEMRFDPGSAIYGEFGPFYIGLRLAADQVGIDLKLL
jgi:chlorite dismutase